MFAIDMCAIDSDAPTKQKNDAPTKQITKTMKLFHVMNIYAINKDDPKDPFHLPFDQWLTLKSIERAKEFIPEGLEVTLVCAILESDMDTLTEKLVPMCDHRVALKRSTKTEFAKLGETEGEIFAKKDLPFMQDVIDAGVFIARGNSTKDHAHAVEDKNKLDDDDFYIMLTNGDIGLSKDFYKFLLPKLKEGRKAFQINRMTLDNIKKYTRLLKPTLDPKKMKNLFQVIDKEIRDGKPHPGTDCWLMSSSIVDDVHLGDQFPGFGHWAPVLRLILRDILAKDDYLEERSRPWGTFHVGDDQNWRKMATGESKITDILWEKYKDVISHCPVQRPMHNAITVMNQYACGTAFPEHYRDFLQESRGGACTYSMKHGWYREESPKCEEFIRMGKYPWGDGDKPNYLTPFKTKK